MLPASPEFITGGDIRKG